MEAMFVVVAMQKRWKGNALKTQCKEWFSLLVKTIEIKRGAESTLRILLESDSDITKMEEFRAHIVTEVMIVKNLKLYLSNDSLSK